MDQAMNLTEHEILAAALEWRASGRGVAICTVVATWGSAPKPIGSHLIVDGHGGFLGSVSGGCIEGDVIAEAVDAVETGTPRLLEFGVSDELAWKSGLTCGGRIKVYVEPFDDELQACVARMIEERAASRPTVLVTTLDHKTPHVFGVEARIASPHAQEIEDVLRAGMSRLVQRDGQQVFLTAFMPEIRLVVVGAVHIAQALSPIVKLAGLAMTVIDPRSAFATNDRFPGARLLAEWPDDVATDLKLTPSDAVATLSHDPKIDDQGLRLALDAGCFYVGALGSRRSHAKRVDRLRAAGIAEQAIKRIHAPIGLAIGAEGPAEIAVAIVAEIISVRRMMAVGTARSAAA